MFFKKNTKSSMETEIFEQASVLDNLFKIHINDNNYILFDIPADVSKIVIVASGSSYHCARFAVDLLEKFSKIEIS